MNKFPLYRVWLLCGGTLVLQWNVDVFHCAWLEPLGGLVVVMPWFTRDVRAIVGVAVGAGLLREALQWAPLGFYVGPYLLVALALSRLARAIPQQHWPLKVVGSSGALVLLALLQRTLRGW